MTRNITNEEVMKELKSVKSMLSKLMREQKTAQTSTWIRSKDVAELTGWSESKLKRLRKQGIIHSKKANDDSRYYLYDYDHILTLKHLFSLKQTA